MSSKKVFADKPYNKCLSCPHRQTKCDGPRTSAMPLLRWCEFMRDMKELNGLTNLDIAERSGVSVKTIERLMALRADNDIMRETARLIEDAIIGSSNQYPCYLAFEENATADSQHFNDAARELERALADNQDYRVALDGIHTSYKAEMQLIRDEAQVKVNFLLEQNAFLRDSLKAKDEQLNHRAYAMNERWTIIERQMKEIDELKTTNAKLLEKLVEKV